MLRRLAGYLFTLLAAVSLVLALASAGMWVRSGWRWDEVRHTAAVTRAGRGTPPGYVRTFKAQSGDGVLWIEWWPAMYHYGPAVPGPPGWTYVGSESQRGLDGLVWFEGYWWAWNRPWMEGVSLRGISDSGDFRVSWLFYVLVFAPLPGLWLGLAGRRVRRRLRRGKLGLCEHCGYDLRASPQRCPECGAHRSSVPRDATHRSS